MYLPITNKVQDKTSGLTNKIISFKKYIYKNMINDMFGRVEDMFASHLKQFWRLKLIFDRLQLCG